jgi:hypothetical protein
MGSTEANNHGIALSTTTYGTPVSLSGAVSQWCIFLGCIKASLSVILFNNLRIHPRYKLHTLRGLVPQGSLIDPTTILRAFIHSLLFIEMLSTSFTALISLLMLPYSINAQPAIAPTNPPALDVKETPISGEAQRPLIADPCNNVNIAQNLDTSTTVTADKAGTFSLSAINLNS